MDEYEFWAPQRGDLVRRQLIQHIQRSIPVYASGAIQIWKDSCEDSSCGSGIREDSGP